MEMERTIAGPFFWPSGYKKRSEVPYALHWEPSSGRLSLLSKPFAAAGSFMRIDNPRFQYAASEREAKTLAEEFFA